MFGHGLLRFQIGESLEDCDVKLQLSLGSSPGIAEANLRLYISRFTLNEWKNTSDTSLPPN